MSAPRTVRPFALDRFEVTVDRFYLFLMAYDAARFPRDDAGAQPGLPGSGWRREWSTDPKLMPPSADSLEKGITACGSWRGLDDAQLPMHCVNWYVALAFCIWDGGRLPSEAEWAFAAMDGDAHRTFPWSIDSEDRQIDQEHACYQDFDHEWDERKNVGERPAGAGAFGQQDLAGNVMEWVADGFQRELNLDACTSEKSERALEDCLAQEVTSTRVQRGGSYASTEHDLLNTSRTNDIPVRKDATVGFRCARDWD
jgi:formylglycine-generating enzyme required for sulfatase activity